MLAAADTSIERFLPTFAHLGARVAFLSPTPTGMEKSIMDAVGDVRALLKETGLHDYELQGQGPENKVVFPARYITADGAVETTASLYRPKTKQGDPRIWFGHLKSYSRPRNLLALLVSERSILVINLSNPEIAESLIQKRHVYDVVRETVEESQSIARELLDRLVAIHKRGYLRSITPGDPGVGDTLENALGISRNSSPMPDYKGIELKATRLTNGGDRRVTTRVNLFSKVPEEGMTYSEIVREYGRRVYNDRNGEWRLSLENTTYASHPNSHGLILKVDQNRDQLSLCYIGDDEMVKSVSYWYLTHLRRRLLEKHHETFWIKADVIIRDNVEWFRYDRIVHTKNPNDLLFGPLIDSDKITLDLLAYISEATGRYRDHGMLFKMWPVDLPLLFGTEDEYDLEDLSRMATSQSRVTKPTLVPRQS